jgi:YhcH/YjgK/YiaL family protein
MILSHLTDVSAYESLHRLFPRAFAYLKDTDFTKLNEGRHDIDADNLFALIQSYPTKPEDQGRWESHRTFIDIQYLLAGRERVGIAPLHAMTESEPYNAEKDLLFHAGTGQFFPLDTNWLAIFHPHDVHMPSLRLNAVSQVTKVVLKVRA